LLLGYRDHRFYPQAELTFLFADFLDWGPVTRVWFWGSCLKTLTYQ